jgi:hypothetical protein
VSNNLVYKHGKGTGKLEVTTEKTVTVKDGKLDWTELYDKHCFSLTRITPV